MSSWANTSRRSLFRLAIQTLFVGRAAAQRGAQSRSLDVDRIASRNVAGVRAVFVRRYRVQASVSLFSIPFFSRDNIGAACVMVEQLAAPTGCTSAIQFSAGSWPDRIKGFNRFGMTQEVMCREGEAILESAYFSFMTSSPEKNDDQAWRAFADPSRAPSLALARGAATRTFYTFALEHMASPLGSTWIDCPQLMMLLRNSNASGQSAIANEKTDHAYPTFLHSVQAAIAGAHNNSQSIFMHNAKLYDLRTTLSADGSAKLLTGHIAERSGQQGSRPESTFRIWFSPADASGLPSRIEFHPRSFLRLVFEQDASADGPIFRCLIPKEND
jgi:hypothetical protein